MAETVVINAGPCGCWTLFVYPDVDTFALLDENGEPLTDESGIILTLETEDMSNPISAQPIFEGVEFPEGAYIPVVLPDDESPTGYALQRFLVGGTSLSFYIDVNSDGTDTITDPRLANKKVSQVQFDYQILALGAYTKEIEDNFITSEDFVTLNPDTTIRIFF